MSKTNTPIISSSTLASHTMNNDHTDYFVPPDANFRIIRGKQKSSKIYVKEPFTYVQDKQMATSDRVYLKCRMKNCYSRATIENGKFLKLSPDRQHTCSQSDDAAMTNITCLEISTKMKIRAETESASFFVSTLLSSVSFYSFPNTSLQQLIIHFFQHYCKTIFLPTMPFLSTLFQTPPYNN